MKTFLSLLLIIFFISACSQPEKADTQTDTSQNEASWAYAFVKYDGISYELTEEEISIVQLGEPIGEVKRNVVDMDTVENYSETDFDSNELPVNTKLFTAKDTAKHIIYERNGKYFIAKK